MPPNPASPVPVAVPVPRWRRGARPGPRSDPLPSPALPSLCRQWLSDSAELAKQRLVWLKEQLAELWKKTPTS